MCCVENAAPSPPQGHFGGSCEMTSEPPTPDNCAADLRGDKSRAEPPGTARLRAEPVRGTETILVVEDDMAVREVAVFLLKNLGYRVLEANDGPSALAVLERAEGIDLLFSDIVMAGGMQGDELGRLVRARDPKIRVLYCSGYPNLRSVKSVPSEDLLSKPYRAEDLALRVRQALDRGDDIRLA